MRLGKTLWVAAAFVGLICMTPAGASAETYDTEQSDHPIRYAVYPIHAVGKGIEYFVTRPIHWFVSQPKLRYVFGRTSNPRTDDYCGDPDLYQRYGY